MSETATTTTTGSELVKAIEVFWSAVADRHPELPRDIIAITGSGEVTGGVVRGHWARDRWSGAEVTGPKRPELFVSGERMADGGRGVATTIIHEAAHALLMVRGDLSMGTSRQGRYHTKKGFAAAAEELGLVAPETADATLGFSDCTMPDETADLYADEIAALDEALGARIIMLTQSTWMAWQFLTGMLLGAGVTVVPWWKGADLAGLLALLGAGVKAPRKPRVRKLMVELECECRVIRVDAATAEVLAEIDCQRCGSALR